MSAKQSKKGKYIVNEYTVIEFLEDEESEGRYFECIPATWFTDETKTMCFWPPKCGTKTVMQRAINCERPDDTWNICQCKVVIGGFLTYARGFKIVRQKCSQKYNTSSADDQSAAANYRRKHPVLALKGERGFEKIFSKPSSKDVRVDQNMLEENRIQLDKNSSESVVTKTVASADVHNMSNVGSENLPDRNSGSTSEQRDCTNKSTSRTTKPASSQTEKGKKHKQSSPKNFSSESNVNAVTASRSSSIHSIIVTTKRSGESVSGGSRTRSRSSRSRSIRSLSRSSCSRSRSRSSRSDSISKKRLFTNHSNSKHGSQSSSDRIDNKSRHEKRHLKSSGRSDSNNLNLSSRAIVKENYKNSVASRHVNRNQQTLEHRKVPPESTQDRGQRLHSEINRSTHNSNVTKRSTHVDVSRSRSNSSRHSMYSYPRSCSSLSRSRDSPSNSCSELRSGAHRKSEAECKVNRLLKLMEKCDQRQIEQDRRLNRLEVTMSKMFIMMGDLSNANNSQVQHRDVQMMSTRQTDIESEDEIDEFDTPKLPVRHLDELHTIHKDLKDKRYRNFLIIHERDFCTPSKRGTHSVTLTKYLKRFISVNVRCKLTLKEKAKSGHTLMSNYHRVYLFLIDVLRAGYRMCTKFITVDEAHTALRTVWGRSKQMKNVDEAKKTNLKRLSETKNKLERRRRH